MRITCPNCAAQYEVEADLVPEDGRDVQCSSCGHVWVQYSDGSAEEIGAAPAEDDTPTEPEDGRVRRRELDDETRRILREEAEREMSKRRGKRPELETQSELDLPDSKTSPRRRDAGPDGAAAETSGDGGSARRTRSREDAARAAASRGDLLPDIEEINSSLSAKDETVAAGYDDTDDSGPSPFRRGFMSVLSVAILAIALYIAAPAIARNVPSLEGPLRTYVSAVNDLRGSIDAVLQRAAVAIDSNT